MRYSSLFILIMVALLSGCQIENTKSYETDPVEVSKDKASVLKSKEMVAAEFLLKKGIEVQQEEQTDVDLSDTLEEEPSTLLDENNASNEDKAVIEEKEIVLKEEPEQKQSTQKPSDNKKQPNEQKKEVEKPSEQPKNSKPKEEKQVEKTEPSKSDSITVSGPSSIEAKVIELTNAERKKHGLSELKVDNTVNSVARRKSEDMQQNNYFSHSSPTYGSPFDMMSHYGISYRAAAENIAYGQQTAEQVVEAWMSSDGHRANILGNYTHIGVGYHSSGHYWTQMFITK
ncbi:CAP domain-containing protein [Bacillus alkalicellulosilyticus]|uniref:CAP domain-containing protein n=1 Tax=Alkalihalobacterium alkalicellulosilyticum TaxID=1912214 RepID=UPI0009962C09|nr:CAP domain-containing protein [Bacillus alkalicellulosilyticus]